MNICIFGLFLITDLSYSQMTYDEAITLPSYSSSVASMELLFDMEHLMVDDLANYAGKLQNKINTLRSCVNMMYRETNHIPVNAEKFLSNPINIFKLIHRLTNLWPNCLNFLKKDSESELTLNIKNWLKKLPKNDDLIEAIESMDLLQEMYNMSVTDIANGRLYGVQYNKKLSSLDLYTIGKELYFSGIYESAEQWLSVALEKFQFQQKNYEFLDFHKEYITAFYQATQLKLEQLNKSKLSHIKIIDNILLISPYNMKLLHRKAKFLFEQLSAHTWDHKCACRGEFPLRPYNLKCYYKTTTNAFVKLAPFKIEEISIDPYIMLYYDVLSDTEIEHLKNNARFKLIRSAVYSEDDGFYIDSYRTSKNYFFEHNETATIEHIDQRISDMTGFDLKDSENLQIANYGLAGHYDVHFDFVPGNHHPDFLEDGNRIATVLFYLSNVSQGGATVFPEIKTAIRPQKGAALLWYNLDDAGSFDHGSLHGSCPVIVGSKWALTKWIREKNQFRSRPCLRR